MEEAVEVEAKPKIYVFTCKYCGKIIHSLYKKQGQINLATHIISCIDKRKETEKEQEEEE